MRSWHVPKKTVAFLTVLCAAAVMACMNRSSPATAKAPAGDDLAAPVAVVELFTSEGCSSCPPADEVLSEVIAKGHGQVFALGFHVDYWDHLGWKDRFSDAAFSQRQRDYARFFRLNGVYTPQMVVNGMSEFVGSDRNRARRAIERALSRPAASKLKLTTEWRRLPAGVVVVYEANPIPPDAILNVALVERRVTSDVRRGENGGRTLRHANVVRAFCAVPVGAKGNGRVELTGAGFSRKRGSRDRRIPARCQRKGRFGRGGFGFTSGARFR